MQETATTETFSTEQQTVVFRLGQESYGIDIFQVNEIIRMREITPVPKSEPHVRGLINLRGKTIPVVDLRVRMSLPTAEATDSTRIIVVETDNGNIGIVVDAVTEVVSLEGQEIHDAPKIVNDLSTDFVHAVAQREGRLITLLNLDRALAV
ncbi:MAG: purine-binding chemotaxis protein CheW [Fimbriimonadaceae bacterium]|nr:purine-binding chemotaxis protein CheW [Fimbriimonadaceae bacterium]